MFIIQQNIDRRSVTKQASCFKKYANVRSTQLTYNLQFIREKKNPSRAID